MPPAALSQDHVLKKRPYQMISAVQNLNAESSYLLVFASKSKLIPIVQADYCLIYTYIYEYNTHRD